MCTTPLHVTSSQLIASEIFPVPAVKALLYPGAVANGIIKNMTVPSWDNLLDIYNLTSVKEAPAVADLQRLEVLFLNLSFHFVLVHYSVFFWENHNVLLGKEAHMIFLLDHTYLHNCWIYQQHKSYFYAVAW